ncbi:hypothetical protein [Microbacterium resistens]|uniref:hypothetical protein n=1 Tax=Microbacterium resistens TaxID=156977 RepID=UPI00082C6E45|nr:hypothetical protein [Microbacterium resistens]
MGYERINEPDGLEVRVPTDDSYRICSTCRGDCEPDTSLSADGTGVRIAWVCPEHGGQGILDPFSDLR